MEGAEFAAEGSIFFELELWTFVNCQPFVQSWQAAILSLLRYVPDVFSIAIYLIGIRYSEIYLIWFGLGTSGSALICWILNLLITRAPRAATCLPIYGAAISWQTQQLGFIITFALTYMVLYRPRLKLWHVWLVVLFYVFTVIAMHLLNYHFGDAILSGAALGTTLGLIYQSFLYYFIVPTFYTQLRSSLLLYWGAQDTLCRGEVIPLRVIALENFDKRFAPTQALIQRHDMQTFIAEQGY